MPFLLIKVRILGLWNVARYHAARRPWLAACLVLAGALILTGTFVGFRTFLLLAQDDGARQDLVYEIFFLLFLFLLAGSVPFVVSTLLHSSEYLLLASAPVRWRSVIAAKLLEAAFTNSLQFSVIGLPAIAACAWALDLPPAGWMLVPILTVLFLLLPALITALLLLLALDLLGTRRVRSAIAAVNVVMASLVCLTAVVQAGHVQFHAASNLHLDALAPGSLSARLGPSAPFAWSLVQMAQGRPASSLRELLWLGVLTMLLYAVCFQFGERLITPPAIAEAEEDRLSTGIGSPWKANRGLYRLLQLPIAGVFAKDIRYVLRDTVLLSQLAMPMVLFVVPMILGIQQSSGMLFATPAEIYPFSVAMTGTILFMQTSILSLSSLGMEGRSFWIMMAAPVPAARALWAKFLLSTLVAAGVGCILTVLGALVFDVAWYGAALQCGAAVLVSAGLCGIGVGLSAAFPRFVYDNPAHRVSVWALILSFFASVAYVTVEGITAAVGWHLATLFPERSLLIYTSAGVLMIAVTAAAAGVPMAIGRLRLERYEWDY
ncbi:MAG: putative ABC transporter permease subunit [Chthonomonadales bacterium]